MVSKVPRRTGVKLAGWGMTGLRHPASHGVLTRLDERAGKLFCGAVGVVISSFEAAGGPCAQRFKRHQAASPHMSATLAMQRW